MQPVAGPEAVQAAIVGRDVVPRNSRTQGVLEERRDPGAFSRVFANAPGSPPSPDALYSQGVRQVSSALTVATSAAGGGTVSHIFPQPGDVSAEVRPEPDSAHAFARKPESEAGHEPLVEPGLAPEAKATPNIPSGYSPRDVEPFGWRGHDRQGQLLAGRMDGTLDPEAPSSQSDSAGPRTSPEPIAPGTREMWIVGSTPVATDVAAPAGKLSATWHQAPEASQPPGQAMPGPFELTATTEPPGLLVGRQGASMDDPGRSIPQVAAANSGLQSIPVSDRSKALVPGNPGRPPLVDPGAGLEPVVPATGGTQPPAEDDPDAQPADTHARGAPELRAPPGTPVRATESFSASEPPQGRSGAASEPVVKQPVPGLVPVVADAKTIASPESRVATDMSSRGLQNAPLVAATPEGSDRLASFERPAAGKTPTSPIATPVPILERVSLAEVSTPVRVVPSPEVDVSLQAQGETIRGDVSARTESVKPTRETTSARTQPLPPVAEAAPVSLQPDVSSIALSSDGGEPGLSPGDMALGTTQGSEPRYSSIQPPQRVETGQGVAHQLSVAIAGATSDKIELVLDPAELGTVRLSLAPEGQSVAVSLVADRAETMDLLRRHIDQLARDLREAGYSDVTFSFGPQTGGGGGHHSTSRLSGSPGSEHGGSADPVSSETLAARPLSDRTTGLDLRM